jgi:hypothetical protein
MTPVVQAFGSTEFQPYEILQEMFGRDTIVMWRKVKIVQKATGGFRT